MINGIPITSRKNNRQIYPNETLIPANHFGVTTDSIVLAYQIRTIDKQRLIKQIGTITDTKYQQNIIEALSFQLAI